MSFSLAENEISLGILEGLAELYEERGIDAQPLRDIMNAMQNPHQRTLQ